MQVILMAGLQGVGKTTACGKLALYLQKQGKKVPRSIRLLLSVTLFAQHQAQPTCKSKSLMPPIVLTAHDWACYSRSTGPAAPPAQNISKDSNNTPPLSTQVSMVATDVYRPAAIDQLVTLGQRVGVPVFEMGTDARPADIAKAGLQHARKVRGPGTMLLRSLHVRDCCEGQALVLCLTVVCMAAG